MMRTSASEDGTGESIVYVPVPQYLLATVYRVLAQALADPAAAGADPDAPAAERALMEIDRIVAVARQPALAAATQPVALPALYDAYRRAYPSIGMGVTPESFARRVLAHCVNVRERFPDPADPRQAAPWLSAPLFKRVASGGYMLLSEEEQGRFRHCVAEDTELVYAEAYEVAALVPPARAPSAGEHP